MGLWLYGADSRMADLVAIYNAAPEDYRTSDGLSGGDRILFESLKEWRRLFDTVTVVTCPSGRVRMERYLGGSEGLRIVIVPTPWWLYRCFPLLFLCKTVAGAVVMARGRWPHGAVVFGSGDIFPDTVAGWAAKVFHGSRIRWANALGTGRTEGRPGGHDGPCRLGQRAIIRRPGDVHRGFHMVRTILSGRLVNTPGSLGRKLGKGRWCQNDNDEQKRLEPRRDGHPFPSRSQHHDDGIKTFWNGDGTKRPGACMEHDVLRHDDERTSGRPGNV